MITHHEINIDPKNIIRYIYDDVAKQIIITSGTVVSKAKFIELWHEQLLILLAAQANIEIFHPTGPCIDPRCAIFDHIREYGFETGKNLLSLEFHCYDNVEIFIECKQHLCLK